MSNVSVRPNNPSNTHEISLAGLGRKWGIKLERGAKSIIEAPVQPSNIEKSGGVAKYGDFDPAFASIEMRDWTGGRGGEFLSDDPTKYYDGYGWSLTPGIWHQAPQWWYGEIQGPTTNSSGSMVSSRDANDNFMPGASRITAAYSMKWHSMESTMHLARQFNQQGSAYRMARGRMWVRKIGTPPAPLKSRLLTTQSSGTRPNSSGAAVTTAALESTSVEALESFVWNIDFTSGAANAVQSTEIGVSFMMEVWTTDGGTQANHWEIGYNNSPISLGNGYTWEGDGTSVGWAATPQQSTKNFYFKITTDPTDRNMHFFNMDRASYAIEEKADNTTGTKLYINGDRGKATTDSAFTTAGLNDTNKTWVADRWVGARIAIVHGVGIGQTAIITGNDSTSITASFAVAPSTDSEYVIYDTNEWTEITPAMVSSAADRPVRHMTVGAPGSLATRSVAYFAFGPSDSIGMFRWTASGGHEFRRQSTAESSNIADTLHAYHDSTGGFIMARGVSSRAVISYTKTTGFEELDFAGTSVRVGGSDFTFTNLLIYNGKLHVFKENSIYLIQGDDRDQVSEINIGLSAFASSVNGQAAVAQNLFLYTNWSYSVERLQKGTMDDIGPWRGAGLKRGHGGPVTSLVPYIAWTLGGLNAGSTGRSAAMAWNGRGWHEFYRTPSSGQKLNSMFMQNNPDAHPRLWMCVDGEFVCQRWPKNTLNPRNDGEIHYQHEAVLETATIDMNAVQLPKLFSQIYGITKNLASSQASIYAEYQLDDDIGSTKWLSVGRFSDSPIDSLNIRRGDKQAIRMRYRGLTENSTLATELHAAVVKAVARTPVRRQWTVRAITGDFQVDAQGLQDADPDDFYMWLQDAAVSAEPLLMRSAWSAMDHIYVYAEQPTLSRLYTTPDGQWGGQLQMTIREIEDSAR